MLARDLVVGMLVLGLLSIAFFIGGFLLTRRWRSLSVLVLGVMVAIAIGTRLLANVYLARLLPFSNAIVVGNWLPPAAAMLIGSVKAMPHIPWPRRLVLAGLVFTLAWYVVFEDLFGPAPTAVPPRFEDGFCVQTTAASCSPCCAAALLMHYQIPASEAELMKLCLTRQNGTPTLGLYRGLKWKTNDTPWRVEIFGGSFESLCQSPHLPAIVFVGAENQSHAVVFFGLGKQGAVVGDPASGMSLWRVDDLRRRWCGTGLRLIERKRGEDLCSAI